MRLTWRPIRAQVRARRPDGGVVTQRTANPCTPVRFRLGPPPSSAPGEDPRACQRACAAITAVFGLRVRTPRLPLAASCRNRRWTLPPDVDPSADGSDRRRRRAAPGLCRHRSGTLARRPEGRPLPDPRGARDGHRAGARAPRSATCACSCSAPPSARCSTSAGCCRSTPMRSISAAAPSPFPAIRAPASRPSPPGSTTAAIPILADDVCVVGFDAGRTRPRPSRHSAAAAVARGARSERPRRSSL